MTDLPQPEAYSPILRLAERLYCKLEHLDPTPGAPNWEGLKEREREYYRLGVEAVFEDGDTVITALNTIDLPDEEIYPSLRAYNLIQTLLTALKEIEAETRQGGQWTTTDINEVALIAINISEGNEPEPQVDMPVSESIERKEGVMSDSGAGFNFGELSSGNYLVTNPRYHNGIEWVENKGFELTVEVGDKLTFNIDAAGVPSVVKED